jgi:hypothetical protein
MAFGEEHDKCGLSRFWFAVDDLLDVCENRPRGCLKLHT